MVADFPKTLSLLRQEKGVSQRSAAASLGVSQALLSHYENGAREPGFDFLVRAASFYGVTTDYLLGRSASRNGTDFTAVVPQCGAEAEDDDSDRIGSGIILNASALLLGLLERCERSSLTDAVTGYLALAVYKAFRYVCLLDPKAAETMFSVPQYSFAELSDAEMKRLELSMKLSVLASANDPADAPAVQFDQETIAKEYPRLSDSLWMLLRRSCLRLKKNEKN